MSSRTCFAVGAALIAACLVDVSLVGQTRGTTTPGLVRGRVVDGSSGHGLGGVTVTVRVKGDSFPIMKLVSDAGGGFVISRPQGLATLVVGAALEGYYGGYWGQSSPLDPPKDVDISQWPAGSDLTLRLWRLGAISGTVRTRRGEPVIRAGVTAMKVVFVGGYPTLSRTGVARTDDRGAYRLFDLEAGDYLIALTQPDPLEEEREVERRQGERQIDPRFGSPLRLKLRGQLGLG